MVPDTLELHSEQPGDEDAIDVVVSRAFQCMDEANLVRMLRERQPEYDPELAVCAWYCDRMVGYALFIPAAIRLMGHEVRAAAVAPVAVAPEHQRRGIAGMITLKLSNPAGVDRERATGPFLS